MNRLSDVPDMSDSSGRLKRLRLRLVRVPGI